MKLLEFKFEDYIKPCLKNNLHPELNDLWDDLPENIKDLPNLILYGASGIGKYTQALKVISKYSKSGLKYERKINFTSNKKNYIYKISDIHFEIDFELLGCNAKILWNDIYYHILEIVKSRPNYSGIILCKNFHKIHQELLEIFYSYMQNMIHHNINIKFIILTKQISFLSKNILHKTKIISIKRPTKSTYCQCIGKKTINDIDISKIGNIKNVFLNNYLNVNQNQEICDRLIYQIMNFEKMKFFENRQILYDLLIYQYDIYDSLWYILKKIMDNKKISNEEMMNIMFYTQCFLTYFNNNYRPIFHLEKLLYLLTKSANGF